MSDQDVTMTAAPAAAAPAPTHTEGGQKQAQSPEQALQALMNQPELSAEQFDTIYAPIMRECQKAGECKYDWEAFRHLLALRLQQVYQDFKSSEPSYGTSLEDITWMCSACKANPAYVHCKRSEQDEEPQDVRYRRMMHMLMAFYKPPFTFQRMCDLLLEPKRYCKTTSKFLLSFSKLVCGISCEVSEDALNVNWTDQRDASLGLPAVQFTTREEDEFLPTHSPLEGGFVNGARTVAPFASSATRAAQQAAITHAVLPSQTYRVGMTAQELIEAQAKERAAKEKLAQQAQQQPQEPAAQPTQTQDQPMEQDQQMQQDGHAAAATTPAADRPPAQPEQQSQQQQQASPMETSD